MIKYKKTKKQLKSYTLIVDDDFSDVNLECNSLFINRDGIYVPENDLVQWFPLKFQTHPHFMHIKLHDSQEYNLNVLLKSI